MADPGLKTSVLKFSISEISNDDISGMGHPSNFLFDCSACYSVDIVIVLKRLKYQLLQTGTVVVEF